jgi:hypothetical protein
MPVCADFAASAGDSPSGKASSSDGSDPLDPLLQLAAAAARAAADAATEASDEEAIQAAKQATAAEAEAEGELATTPEGRVYSWHYLNETGPIRNIPGSVVDETIDNATDIQDMATGPYTTMPRTTLPSFKATRPGRS